MDNLTHTLTGLALSRAGLHRACPRAAFLMMLAANAPDIDAVSALSGSITYLQYHRHITHSIAALPLVALLPVVLMRLFSRGPFAWRGAYLISIAGVASHLALDGANQYGVRYLLPFSDRWFSLDAVAVVDLWIWAALLVSVLAPALGTLVSSEIGGQKNSGRGAAIFALCFLLLYTGARKVLQDRALAELDSRVYTGGVPRRTGAFPTAVNPLLWRGVVDGEEFAAVFDVNLLKEFDPHAGQYFYKPKDVPAIEKIQEAGEFKTFLGFARFPLWWALPVPGEEGSMLVSAVDLRFASPRRPGFVATAVVNARMEVMRPRFEFGTADVRGDQ